MAEVIHLDKEELRRIDRSHVSEGLLKEHVERIKRRLKELGAGRYNMMLPETDTIPLVIQPNEKIEGIVFGKYKQDVPGGALLGRGALIATDYRILLMDHKPLYMRCDEISYRVVSGISYTRVGLASTIILHTRLGNISIRTFNQNTAHLFVEAIENSVLTGKLLNGSNDY